MKYTAIDTSLLFEKNSLNKLQQDIIDTLDEQGIVHINDETIEIPWDNLLSLDSDLKSALSIPKLFDGNIYLKPINALTTNEHFHINYGYYFNNKEIFPDRRGGLLKFNGSEYLMSIPLYNAVMALEKHKSLPLKTEEDNLFLIYSLKNAVNQGLKLNLQHFNNFEFTIPKKITLKIEKQLNGDLQVTPSFTNSENPSDVRSRLYALERNVRAQSLRIKKSIVILTPEQKVAVNEAIKIMTVDKKVAEDFLQNPTSYIDANKIDLEHGFSSRVVGISTFKLAYFGDQEKTGISWFNETTNNTTTETKQYIHNIQDLGEYITSPDEIKEFKNILDDARNCKADTVEFSGQLFDISNEDRLNETLKNIENGDYRHLDNEPKATKKLVLKIKQNDDVLEYEELHENSPELYHGNINQDNYKLKFHPHQNIGIRWLLSFAERSLIDDKTSGCLLADDMGLGKTFMSLVALREYLLLAQKYKKNRKPVLVVAPVSLLENWRDEMEKCYTSPVFNKIILLTATGELSNYIQQQSRGDLVYSKSINIDDLKLSEVKHSLKIGPQYGNDRLDAPENIVLTNYDTLRAYSASFAMVKWSEIIFDEIQMIKNPNTLTSNAAKALQGDFKLAITGTPVENSLKDIWNIFDTVNSGLLGEFQKFRETYIKPILTSTPEEKEVIGKQLRQKIGISMLRREKSECAKSLPKKTIYKGIANEKDTESTYSPILDIPMNPKQIEQYEETIGCYKNSDDKRSKALSTLQKIKQISLCPLLLSDTLPFSEITTNALFESSEKLKALLKILDLIKSRNEKVIIFLINKKLQILLQQALQDKYNLKIHIINGDVGSVDTANIKSRKSLINDFERQNGFNIIIMSPIAAGVGLTIVGANNVIHLERHWNPAKEAQATDRVYRIGQTKDVNIYIPMAKLPMGQSFDEHLDTLLSQKINLNKAIVTPSNLTEEEFAAEVLDN